MRGVSAVPELIALLDDKRMTAYYVPQIMNSIPRVRQVGELAEMLLEQISGQDRNERFRVTVPKSTQYWKDWWAKNHDRPEKEILLENAFTRSRDRIMRVNQLPVRILAERYPEELAALGKSYLDKAVGSLQPFTLAEAYARARLPKEERVKLLLALLVDDNIEHQWCVLQVLAQLDAKKCSELVGPIIDKLPVRPSGPLWTCPEASYTHVVKRLEDDRIWKKYLDHTRKCEVALRLEIMNPLSYGYFKEENRQRRLGFLAAFLDDEALRPEAKEDGPYAAFTFPKITVRDFVVMEIAYILKLDDSPDEFWTAEQWTKLREKVKEALKSEKLPDWAK
jgi:hypothetical protein